jgi:hypothetical protein
MNISNLSSSQLRRAASIKDLIEALQTKLTKILGGKANGGAAPARPVHKRRKMSAAGRAKIAAAARARWARVKAAKK